MAQNLSKLVPWCSLRQPIQRTMLTTTPNPEARRGVRFLSGKWGSIMPVTGFRSVVGANAAYVGRGRSCDKKGAKTWEHTDAHMAGKWSAFRGRYDISNSIRKAGIRPCYWCESVKTECFVYHETGIILIQCFVLIRSD